MSISPTPVNAGNSWRIEVPGHHHHPTINPWHKANSTGNGPPAPALRVPDNGNNPTGNRPKGPAQRTNVMDHRSNGNRLQAPAQRAHNTAYYNPVPRTYSSPKQGQGLLGNTPLPHGFLPHNAILNATAPPMHYRDLGYIDWVAKETANIMPANSKCSHLWLFNQIRSPTNRGPHPVTMNRYDRSFNQDIYQIDCAITFARERLGPLVQHIHCAFFIQRMCYP